MNAPANFLFLDSTAFFGLVEVPNDHNHSTIEIMQAGEWLHERHGDVDLNFKLMDAIRRNFEKFSMAGRVPVDFNHGSEVPVEEATAERAKAAGFVQKLLIVGNKGVESLRAVVKWTEEGARRIRAGEYKLISPAFQGNYSHPHAKKNIGPWLHSVALTNRPFLKTMGGGMQPVALSDSAARLFNDKEGDPEMDFVTIEYNGAKYRVAKEDEASFRKMLTDNAAAATSSQEALTAETARLTDAQAQVTTLTEAASKGSNDNGAQTAAITLLSEQNKSLVARLTKVEKTTAETGAAVLLKEAVSKHLISAKEAEADGPWAKTAESNPGLFSELIANRSPVVPVKPAGGDSNIEPGSNEQTKIFNDHVRKRVKALKEDGHDLDDGELMMLAQDQISDENPELADVAFGVTTK